MADEYYATIKRIVEGQITSYLNDHPEISEAYIGKRKSGRTKKQALTSSLAKRIVNDLGGEHQRLRLSKIIHGPSL